MFKRMEVAGLLVATLLAAACSESLGPAGPAANAPRFATLAPAAPGAGIALDQLNGTLNESGNFFIKGFNNTNPHHGDAIVATFFWVGSTNIIDSVTDVLTLPGYPRVGNKYNLVEYVTSGGISMATYVATNVQGFPDGFNAPAQDSILAVRADLSQSVTDGGLLISAWSGVDAVTTQVVGSHSAAAGSGSTATVADPGTVAVGAGALALGVTLSNALVGAEAPAGFTTLAVQSDANMVDETNYLVASNVGSVDPRWTWNFTQASTWLATTFTLNPPPHLAFTVQPSTTLPLMTIQPAVRVTVLDALGNPATSYNGPVTIAIGHNGGLLVPGTLSGTTTVTAVNGVATFSDLSIDQPGNGYTLVVSGLRLTDAESAPFNIGPF